jgi:hypothetical protein
MTSKTEPSVVADPRQAGCQLKAPIDILKTRRSILACTGRCVSQKAKPHDTSTKNECRSFEVSECKDHWEQYSKDAFILLHG